eukprot:3913290-Amphidinium_carterae.1
MWGLGGAVMSVHGVGWVVGTHRSRTKTSFKILSINKHTISPCMGFAPVFGFLPRIDTGNQPHVHLVYVATTTCVCNSGHRVLMRPCGAPIALALGAAIDG